MFIVPATILSSVSSITFAYCDQQVAELMVKRCVPKAVLVVSLVLRFLSSRIGTLVLCGCICFHKKWPFVHSFSELSSDKRESILRNWSKETFLLPLRIAFLLLKVITLFIFFSWVMMHVLKFFTFRRFLRKNMS